MSWLNQIRNKIHYKQSSTFKKPIDKKVVFTNGCFDILHKGHVEYLAQAADLGDFLVVGINSDASVQRQGKGEGRPINKIEARSTLLAALSFVDAVLEFDGETPVRLIENLRPDVLVKGADYDPEESRTENKGYIVGREAVMANGGEVKVIDLVQGYSTTNILNKLNNDD
ncbi:MAG: rfaE bifunctional protein nucleotidyltransferase chain/domain [Arenicella sp.]|jgi:rfaE bifunctional protein nucleotidyltransferase chain/domain